MLSVRYIISELEEIEREDNFRLKRFKEFKTKKNKGNEDVNHHCYCDKKPGKGDDFVCEVCRQEEEDKKKSLRGVNTLACVPEVIGDKASSINTVTRKCMDDLSTDLKKVISLTSHCKMEGLVSPSLDTYIYTCNEVRGKLDNNDQTQACCMAKEVQNASCEGCDNAKKPQTLQDGPCDVCNTKPEQSQNDETCCKICSDKVEAPETEDSMGLYETKYKETVKVIKYKNDDGTISEEKQVITIKTERKHPYKPDESCDVCKKNDIDSLSSKEFDSKSEECCTNQNKDVKQIKSETCKICNEKGQTDAPCGICASDVGENDKKGTSNDCCKICASKAQANVTPSTSCHTCKSRNEKEEKKVKCSVCAANEEKNKKKETNTPSCCKICGKKSQTNVTSSSSCNTCKSCNKKEETKVKCSVCAANEEKNRETNTQSCCKICGKKAQKNETPSSLSHCHICHKQCSSAIDTKKSKVSTKSSNTSRKDVSCECEVEIKSVCCDAMWKDVGNSTSDLTDDHEDTEDSCKCIKDSGKTKDREETEESCKCIKDSDKIKDREETEESCKCIKESKPKKEDKKPCCVKSTTNSEEICCAQKQASKKSSHTCSICNKKDVSTTTSNFEMNQSSKASNEKSGPVKSHSCIKTKTENKKTDFNPNACCKIRIIRKQDKGSESKEEPISEVIFFGSILDAIKTVLAPDKSEEKSDGRSCCCTSKNSPRNLSAKSSVKSSRCQTCETGSQDASDGVSSSTYVSCKCIDVTQSCPQCGGKTDQKSVKRSQRSKSHENTSNKKADKNASTKSICSCGKPQPEEAPDTKCSLCGGELPNATKSDTEKNPCCPCKDAKEDSVDEDTTESSECKQCQTNEQKNQKRTQKSLEVSCPICLKSLEEQQKKSENACCCAPKEEPVKPPCCGCKELDNDEEVAMKEVSTSTRRSDRYDVRPLNMVQPKKEPTCTCRSDSYLNKGSKPKMAYRSKSCSSCR